MSAVGGDTFLVFANVDGEGDPDGKEHAPVDEFEGQGQVGVREGTVNHAGGHDPDEREEGPDALRKKLAYCVQRDGRGRYSSDGEADFFPSGDLIEGV